MIASVILDKLEAASPSTWAVQLYLISIDNTTKRQLGLDIAPSLEIAATFAIGSNSIPSAIGVAGNSASLRGAFDSVLQAVHSDKGVKIVAEPLFLLSDGTEGFFQRGDNLPVPRRIHQRTGICDHSRIRYD